MPKTLSPAAQQEWKRMSRLLAARGTLTKEDGPALEVYCETYARHQALLKELQQYGEMVDSTITDSSGVSHPKRVQNPAGKVATQLGNAIRAWHTAFGVTPASREKAKRAEQAPPKAKELTPEQQEEQFAERLITKRPFPEIETREENQ
jgi:P27 family predicted phage terminase small subunit